MNAPPPRPESGKPVLRGRLAGYAFLLAGMHQLAAWCVRWESMVFGDSSVFPCLLILIGVALVSGVRNAHVVGVAMALFAAVWGLLPIGVSTVNVVTSLLASNPIEWLPTSEVARALAIAGVAAVPLALLASGETRRWFRDTRATPRLRLRLEHLFALTAAASVILAVAAPRFRSDSVVLQTRQRIERHSDGRQFGVGLTIALPQTLAAPTIQHMVLVQLPTGPARFQFREATLVVDGARIELDPGRQLHEYRRGELTEVRCPARYADVLSYFSEERPRRSIEDFQAYLAERERYATRDAS